MVADPTPLNYRSQQDAARDDVGATVRTMRTWALLCAVWGIGLVVWAGYLGLIAVIVVKALS